MASAKARVKEDEKRSRKLGYLLEEFDEFDNQIKTERNYTKEIEGQIQMMKKKALELAAKQISEDKYQERILKVRHLPLMQPECIKFNVGWANCSNPGEQVRSAN